MMKIYGSRPGRSETGRLYCLRIAIDLPSLTNLQFLQWCDEYSLANFCSYSNTNGHCVDSNIYSSL